jgi:hypothetical protein
MGITIGCDLKHTMLELTSGCDSFFLLRRAFFISFMQYLCVTAGFEPAVYCNSAYSGSIDPQNMPLIPPPP